MEVFAIIREGIINDEISYFVFQVLLTIFLVDIGLYFLIWLNLIIFNWQIREGSIYHRPLKGVIQGFEELLKISSQQVNTRAYIEDFFSSYKAILLPLPLIRGVRIPVISSIKFIKNTVSLFILVGVLGTFIGIYTSLVSVLNTNSPDNILPGLESISPLLSGMGTAFATSIVGMSLALIITFILKLFNAEQFLAGMMARLENYLDNEIKITQKSTLTLQLQQLMGVMDRGFNGMTANMTEIYEAIKGFKTFSQQFDQAAASMADFNTNLSGSMNDLTQLYQLNKEFTLGFSQNIKEIGSKFDKLFTGIDHFTDQQSQVREFLEDNQKAQEQNIALLNSMRQEIAESQQDLRQTNSRMREEFSRDVHKLDNIFEIIDTTISQQKHLTDDFKGVLTSISAMREELTVNFADSLQELQQTMSAIKTNYQRDMGRNVKTFTEHVSISNQLINNGFESLIDKFENMDLILAKYLSGLSFNAGDLEQAVRNLDQSVTKVNNNLQKQQQLIEGLGELIRENKLSTQDYQKTVTELKEIIQENEEEINYGN